MPKCLKYASIYTAVVSGHLVVVHLVTEFSHCLDVAQRTRQEMLVLCPTAGPLQENFCQLSTNLACQQECPLQGSQVAIKVTEHTVDLAQDLFGQGVRVQGEINQDQDG